MGEPRVYNGIALVAGRRPTDRATTAIAEGERIAILHLEASLLRRLFEALVVRLLYRLRLNGLLIRLQ